MKNQLLPGSRLLTLWLFAILVFGAGPLVASESNPREELLEQIRSLEEAPGFSPRDTAYINLLAELAGEMRFYEADSLHNLASRTLELSQQAAYQKGECSAYMRLGDYHSDKGNADKAIEFYQKGLSLSKLIDDEALQLRLLNNLSGEFAYKSDIGGALNGYLAALELAEHIGDLDMQSIINENIANLYADQKDYEESLTYYKKVKRLNDTIDNDLFRAETMSNLASVYADMGQLEYAMFNINQSIDVFEEHRVLDWLAYAYETKGKVYLKKSNYKWALYWYRHGEMLHQQLDDDRSRIDLLNGMAEAHFGQGSDSLANVYATEALRVSQKINFVEGTRSCAQTLYQIHKRKEDYATALVYHELFQSLSDSLSRSENRQALKLHKTKTEYERQKAALMEANEMALAQQKRYIRIGWIMLLISVVIIYLVNRSKKLQKRLAKELGAKKDILEKRRAELQANNETKTKLFSIIGHDLRGPIGALQGLLQMFRDGDVAKEEFLSFIPKLRQDVDHIYFTLNNLLSWGNSQLNGSVTTPEDVSPAQIVRDNMNLLSEIAEHKSIRIVNEVPETMQAWADPHQLDIVVRNLMSNALKFTPENGMVTIKASEEADHWIVSVRDSGVGMDRITLGRLFKEKSNHSTYGTNNEKGTGIGLSLCKEMVENNGGKIWVDSILRKGSTFYFTLRKSGAASLSKAV